MRSFEGMVQTALEKQITPPLVRNLLRDPPLVELGRRGDAVEDDRTSAGVSEGERARAGRRAERAGKTLMAGGVKNVANTCQEKAQTQLHNQ